MLVRLKLDVLTLANLISETNVYGQTFRSLLLDIIKNCDGMVILEVCILLEGSCLSF